MKRATILALVVVAFACGDDAGPGLTPRPFLMGFSAIPPSVDPAIVVPAINLWAQRADAAIIHASPPWAAMIGGYSPADAVDTVQVPLANYFRAKGLALVFTVDATDGLNRAAQAPELVALGRSVADPAIQRLYREWVFAVADKLRPAYLGLVAETNLIKALAPDSVYQALVGGWPSVPVGGVASSEAVQARYIARHVELLDDANARGVFQLTFYDLDTTGLGVPPGSSLTLFTHPGLADSALQAKPALAVWDSVFSRRALRTN